MLILTLHPYPINADTGRPRSAPGTHAHEAFDSGRHTLLHVLRQARKHRKREDPPGDPLGDRQTAGSVAPLAIAVLQVHRFRVMEARLNAQTLQVLCETVSIF